MNVPILLGVEEEFLVVDECFHLAPNGKTIINIANECRQGFFSREMFTTIVETKTPICQSSEELHFEIEQNRKIFAVSAKECRSQLCALSVHPFESIGAELYSTDIERYQWMKHHFKRPVLNHAGMHLHTKVGNPQISLHVLQSIIKYLPIFLAISANSQFDNGSDTLTKSCRRTLHIPGIPFTGVPKIFQSFDEYSGFVRKIVRRQMIRDERMVWWDLRINYQHGTLELRICDTVKDTRLVVAIADLFAVIAHQQARRQQEERILQPFDILEYNIEAAGTFGLDANIFDLDRDQYIPIREYIYQTLDHHLDIATKENKISSFEYLRSFIEQGPLNIASKEEAEQFLKNSILKII